MFEESLQEAFRKIFKVEKITYAQPGESREQHCIFVEIQSSRNSFRDGKAIARVTGTAVMFAGAEQVPFGFFSKAIAQADPALVAPFFFFDFEENTRRFQDLVQRSFSFVYFFEEQYDPETGQITSVKFTVEGT